MTVKFQKLKAIFFTSVLVLSPLQKVGAQAAIASGIGNVGYNGDLPDTSYNSDDVGKAESEIRVSAQISKVGQQVTFRTEVDINAYAKLNRVLLQSYPTVRYDSQSFLGTNGWLFQLLNANISSINPDVSSINEKFKQELPILFGVSSFEDHIQAVSLLGPLKFGLIKIEIDGEISRQDFVNFLYLIANKPGAINRVPNLIPSNVEYDAATVVLNKNGLEVTDKNVIAIVYAARNYSNLARIMPEFSQQHGVDNTSVPVTPMP